MSGRGQARRWGWHRLVDPWPERIVEAAGVRAGQLVLDLGAGDGGLVRPLLAVGARVLAVELHEGRAARLTATFPGSIAQRQLTVLRCDIADVRLPGRPYRVVANPPFSGASALIRRLTARRSPLYAADLVVPYGVACRLRERPVRGFEIGIRLRIPRSAFAPEPDVESVLLQIRR